MPKKISLLGNVYGNLTVIDEYAIKGERVHWKCKCSCGNVSIVKAKYLRNGDRSSCGCDEKEKRIARWVKKGRLSLFEIGERYNYMHYKRDSKVRDLEFGLSKEQFRSIVSGNCEYCGSAPSENATYLKGEDKRSYIPGVSPVYKCNGIDRVDNKKGYIQDNCVPCCAKCNLMKKTWSVSEFKNHIDKIYNHSGSFDFSLIDMCKNKSSVLEFISKAA